MKYAKIEDGVVVQIDVNPREGFIEVNDNVVPYQVLVDGEFVNPTPPEKTYVQLRKEAYPPLPEQLDYMYHNGFDAWKTMIEAIKTQYPKPE